MGYMRHKNASLPTSYCLDLLRLLASGQKDNISLSVVDVIVFDIEQLIYSIFLKSTELDEQSDGSRKRLLDYKVLLPWHLGKSDGVA